VVLDWFLMIIHGMERGFTLPQILSFLCSQDLISSDPLTCQCLLDFWCFFWYKIWRAAYFLVLVFYHKPCVLDQEFEEVS
jgi:hypothetical protein